MLGRKRGSEIMRTTFRTSEEREFHKTNGANSQRSKTSIEEIRVKKAAGLGQTTTKMPKLSILVIKRQEDVLSAGSSEIVIC